MFRRGIANNNNSLGYFKLWKCFPNLETLLEPLTSSLNSLSLRTGNLSLYPWNGVKPGNRSPTELVIHKNVLQQSFTQEVRISYLEPLLNGILSLWPSQTKRWDSQCSSMVAKCTMALEVADQLRDWWQVLARPLRGQRCGKENLRILWREKAAGSLNNPNTPCHRLDFHWCFVGMGFGWNIGLNKLRYFLVRNSY